MSPGRAARVGSRLLWFGLLYALGLVVFGAMGLGLQRAVDALHGPPATAPVRPAATAAVRGSPGVSLLPAAPAPEAAPGRTGFDIVRVTPDGQALLAGHAPAGAMVAVTVGGHLLGTVRADEAGSWLLLPRQPLHQGSLALAVRIVGGSGQPGSR